VATELTRWAPHLEHAQDESLAALQQAREAHAARAANVVMTAAPQPGDPPPSPAEQAETRRRQEAIATAEADLAAAVRRLDEAKEYRDHQAKATERAIRDAVEDDVKDSWWDSVKDWVDRNAGWLQTLTEALSWIATALAIAALFIPGVNLIVLLSLGALVLAGRSLLAASDNGSWFDVGLDIFALLTLGTGRIATRGLKSVHAATRRAAASAARKEAKKRAMKASAQKRAGLGRQLNARGVKAAHRRGIRRQIDDMHRAARREGGIAAREIRDRPLAQATRAEGVSAGYDMNSARYWNDINQLRREFPTDPGVLQASRPAETWRRTNRIAFGSGAASDLGDKFAGDMFGRKEPIQPYQDFKKAEFWRTEIGSTW
jgi:hypothetical protein